uniref:XdhC protein (Assists in molybdopterin insertion into xanthine dehydrogenase) n=1 Tax=uncultured Thiotrichaceae bacterium TaxID=298394 RepID=A0A6S6UEL0_9GAMM|nr:MAG: XdhC protein (assists in molybdopterin insertion into xanthine dehydrogenase) [uncultured Thiotrichaceae bacterium]
MGERGGFKALASGVVIMSIWQKKPADLLSRHQAVILLTVMETKGSVPRGVGTQMLVASDECFGTIGGGHLEFQCMNMARQRLDHQADWVQITERFPLGAKLGQCCGGLVVVSLQYIDKPDMAVFTGSGSVPAFHLVLFGAGHVGRAVVHVLAQIDCQVTWVDSREDAFLAEIPAHVRKVVAEYPEDEVADAPEGACYLVMTHDHGLDQRICEAVLKRGDFRYCGLIGSLTKRRKFEQRLLGRGFSEADLARLVCPIGIAGISGKEPGVIAVGVVGELLCQVVPMSG